MASSPSTSTYAFRARWIVPVSGPPLASGIVSVINGRIAAVGENITGAPVLDWGDVAVLPGLVNAHTHLEFSGLSAPLGDPTQGFAAWIRSVVQWRVAWKETCGGESAVAQQRLADVTNGLAESRRAGVVCLGEIATGDWPAAAFESKPLAAEAAGAGTADSSPLLPPAATVFLELLGLAPQRAAALLELARQHLRRAAEPGVSWQPGISPHAPYTVGVELVRTICQWSSEQGWPVAMHLAETTEELELMQSHSGPLVELLSEWNVWEPSAVPRGIRPTDYLELLATARRALVIHGNYLSSRDWEFLAANRDRLTVVYCPRTHEYFGHGEYPLREMLAAGVAVAVGTDSRASTPDLDLLADLRTIRRRFPDLAPRQILELGTRCGAAALARDADWGTLEPGKRAEFTVRPLDDPHTTDVEAALLE